jgi:hypothetical protein
MGFLPPSLVVSDPVLSAVSQTRGHGDVLNLLETASHSSFLESPLANLVNDPTLVALSLFHLVGKV